MTVVAALTRTPVTVPLTGAYAGASVTLRRLTAPQFHDCQSRALALLANPEDLLIILARHELFENAAGLRAVMANPMANAGLAQWLAEVECGIEAISAWDGFTVEGGAPAPLARDRGKIAGVAEPSDLSDLQARLTMETFFLDPALGRALAREITAAAMIVVTEGNGCGVSATGTAGPAPTAGIPHGVETASAPAKPAPPAAATAPGDAVPPPNTAL